MSKENLETPSADSKTAALNVRLPLDTFAGVEAARAEGQTRTEVVVRLLTVGLQHIAEENDSQSAVEALMEQMASHVAAKEEAEAALRRLQEAGTRAADALVVSDDDLFRRVSAASEEPGAHPILPTLKARLQGWLHRNAQRPAEAMSVDLAMKARLAELAQTMSSGGILGELGVTLSVEHVLRLALSRGIAVLEGGGGRSEAPSQPSAPSPYASPVRPMLPVPPPPTQPTARLTPGAYPGAWGGNGQQGQPAPYTAAMQISKHELDNRPTQYGSKMMSNRSAMAEATGDTSDKMEDIPQNAGPRLVDGRGLLPPDPSWRPWSPDVDGEIPPTEVKMHYYYSMNGWYRWMKPLGNGKIMTFYWSDDPRAQAIEPFKGSSELVVEVLPTGDRGAAHAVAIIVP